MRRTLLLTLLWMATSIGCAGGGHAGGRGPVLVPAGAGDSRVDRAAIQGAIDRAATRGGGVVVLGEGAWLSDGPIELKSGVELRLGRGAVLEFSDDFGAYPPIDHRIEGIELWGPSPLIHARGARDIAITGEGVIDGNGERWWADFRERYPTRGEGPRTERHRRYARMNEGRTRRNDVWYAARPTLVGISESTGVLIEGVTLKDSPFWTLHPVYCEGVTIRGVRIEAPQDSPNTDGIDPDSCVDVLIEDCIIACGDDAIAIKSGYNEDGRRVGRASEGIVVRGCTFVGGRSGVAIGSETAGSVRDVLIENCRFEGTLRGLRIKSGRGRGGVIEGIVLRDSVMLDVPQAALQVDFRYTGGGPGELDEGTPRLGRVEIEGVRIEGAGRAVELRALEEAPGGPVVLRDVVATGVREGVVAEFVSVEMVDLKVVVDE